MAFRSPLEPLLVRRGAPDLVFYDTKRGCVFFGGGRGEVRRSAVSVAVQDSLGCFLGLREPPNPVNYDTKRLRLAKYLVNYGMKCFQEAPKPRPKGPQDPPKGGRTL